MRKNDQGSGISDRGVWKASQKKRQLRPERMIRHRLKEEAFKTKRTAKKKARGRNTLECLRQIEEAGRVGERKFGGGGGVGGSLLAIGMDLEAQEVLKNIFFKLW